MNTQPKTNKMATKSIKKLQADLSKAIRIVAVAFEGKFDRSGIPYFEHCYTVMSNLNTDDIELKIIAILHDLIEDCPEWTIERLREEGFTERVLDSLVLLTRDHSDMSDEAYDAYIHGIGTNFDAARVKVKDNEHNMDLTRLKTINENALRRNLKYGKARNFLMGKIDNFLGKGAK